jgi:hypothetical protein
VRQLLTACLLAAFAVAGAGPAAADPQDLVPWCSGDQTPMDSDCREMAHQIFTHGSGTDPELPTGTDPGSAPVT